MPMKYSGDNLTFPDNSIQNTAATGFGFKNRIINGDMRIDQRNAGASVTPASGDYTVDRFQYFASQASKASVQRSATAPTGFVNSALITSLSAYTVGASEVFGYRQPIEGLNVADLAWGTANAVTVTLSFWVRSSLTGTFGGSLNNSAQNRSYPFSYTINSANTFEYKTVTIAGDQSGTWLTTNGVGIYVSFSMGAGATYIGTAGSWAGALYYSATGATNLISTNGATFYITGVQLEKGSTATSFDYRPYGTEFALCQRYYQQISGNGIPLASGYARSSGIIYAQVPLVCSMRAAPTVTSASGTSYFMAEYGAAASTGFSSMSLYLAGPSSVQLQTPAIGATTSSGAILFLNNAASYVGFNAEL